LKTLPLPQVDAVLAEEKRERLIALSREKYATPRAEVEAILAKQWQAKPEPEPVTRKTPPDESPGPPQTEEPISRPKRTVRKTPEPISGELPLLGKGGRQHKYLQNMVKRLAEDKGFKATIEKAVLGGKGSVDVALGRDGRAVACEISVSTNSEQELGNIQKCLAAGFETVLVISPEKKNLTGIREAVESNLERTKPIVSVI
jgi:hypothetical protein